MAIPDYQSIMLPLLQFAGDGQEHALRATIPQLMIEFNIGVTSVGTYEIKRVDTDYFTED
jgi:restriction system protein